MKKIKLTSLMLGVGLVAITLASCSGSNPQTTTSSIAPTTTTTTTSNTPTTTTESQPTTTKSDVTNTSTTQEVEGLTSKEIEVTMVSHFPNDVGGAEYTDKCNYSDYWFLEDSQKINYELAVASAMAGGAAYASPNDEKGKNIADFLTNAGYTNIEKNQYLNEGIATKDSIGLIMGEKQIKNNEGEEYTLLALFPRNAGYKDEWMSNFDIGSSGAHKGFMDARDEALRFMKHYINENNITGKLKVWCAGYSRGAATMNLTGGFLAEDNGYFGNDVSLSPNDLFVYTIGTPNTITNDLNKTTVLSVSGARENHLDTNVEAYTYTGNNVTIDPTANQYKSIYNFVAIGDYIAKLPPKEWGFTRYGTTLNVLFGDDKMLEYLHKLSPSTADSFIGIDYAKKKHLISFDLNQFQIIEKDEALSADEYVNSLISNLLSLVDERKDLIEKDYAKILGAITSIYGISLDDTPNPGNIDGPLNKIKSDVKSLISAGVLNYLTNVIEKFNTTDSIGIKKFIIELMNFLGKEIQDVENYTDQQLLKDIFDLIINDYSYNPDASIRFALLSFIIPAPYGRVYSGILDYAKEKQLKIETLDDILSLIANYVHENKTDENVDAVVEKLAGLIPEQYAPILGVISGKTYDVADYKDETEMKKVGLFDSFDALAIGRLKEDNSVDLEASAVRGTLLSMIKLYASMKGASKLNDTISNGSYEEGTKVVTDPVELSIIINEVLNMVLPKNEQNELTSIKENANKALINLIDKFKTENNSSYIEMLKEYPDKIRQILFTLIFKNNATYSLQNDVDNALAAYSTIPFLVPAHYHELYISYLQGQI